MSLAVISCVWQRIERLERTLAMLEAQTLKEFDLWLVNNNIAQAKTVNQVLFGRGRELRGGGRHNETNRGPFARIETIHALRHDYDYFLTLDDDADFDETLLAQWWEQRDPNAVQGWQGFRFTPGGTYWQRTEAQPGEPCDYLWGSNMLIPAAAVADPGVLELPERYRLACDDLWLCYWASQHAGLELRKAKIKGLRIVNDGKDTYRRNQDLKTELLNELRKRGWNA